MNNFIGISSLVFCDISIKSNVFINSHGYLKLGICMLNHWVKRLYLGINLVSCLVI